MFTGIFEPAFLQAASQHKKEEPILVPHILIHVNRNMTKTPYICGNDIEIWTKHNGEKMVYSLPGNSDYKIANIQADADTDIIILGGITLIQWEGYTNAATIFDASKAPDTFVTVEGGSGLDVAEVIKVSASLTAIDGTWGVNTLKVLQCPANQQYVTKYFKDNMEIAAATPEGGTLYIDENAQYASGLIAAAQARNWTVLPLPEG